MRLKTNRPPAKILSVLALGAACWTATAAQTARPAKPGTPAPLPTAAQREALIATGDTPDLFLMYTGDVIGYLDPCG